MNKLWMILLLPAFALHAQVKPELQTKLFAEADKAIPKVIEWRRHIHQNPELSDQEEKTAAYIAAHLRTLGLKVTTGVARNGVVALLETGKPGPVIALRADIDALPVTERNSLPFASQVKTTYKGETTGVMHACGHDAHTAILMAAAQLLVAQKNQLRGTIKFIFQPAEEGSADGVIGGANLMVREGVMENPKVDAVFGLHVDSTLPVGKIAYRKKGIMAAADWFSIHVQGKQAHGATPWMSVDPIVVSAQIVMGLQTIISRQTELTKDAAVITVGRIHSGIRENIIPEEATMAGTIRTLDAEMQTRLHQQMKQTVEKIAESAGAKATLKIENKTLITYNDPALTDKVLPAMIRAAGKENVEEINPETGAEDFSFYQEKAPGVFFFVGCLSPNTPKDKIPSHHTPDFILDENGFITGLKTMLAITTEYMFSK